MSSVLVTPGHSRTPVESPAPAGWHLPAPTRPAAARASELDPGHGVPSWRARGSWPDASRRLRLPWHQVPPRGSKRPAKTSPRKFGDFLIKAFGSSFLLTLRFGVTSAVHRLLSSFELLYKWVSRDFRCLPRMTGSQRSTRVPEPCAAQDLDHPCSMVFDGELHGVDTLAVT